MGGSLTTESVANESFMANGLTPNTNYSFRVAGVNEDGMGPFSTSLFFLTDGTIETIIYLPMHIKLYS